MSAKPWGVEAGSDLTILKKGLILTAIPLLAQLLFLAVSIKMRQDQMQAQEWAIHSKDVIAQTEGAFRLVMEARSAVRSLSLTGDLAFIAAWEKARNEALRQFRALSELVSDNPLQQERVEGIRQQSEAVLARMDGIAQLGWRSETRDKALATLREAWALRFIDDLRLRVNDFLEDEILNAQRQERLEMAGREQA